MRDREDEDSTWHCNAAHFIEAPLPFVKMVLSLASEIPDSPLCGQGFVLSFLGVCRPMAPVLPVEYMALPVKVSFCRCRDIVSEIHMLRRSALENAVHDLHARSQRGKRGGLTSAAAAHGSDTPRIDGAGHKTSKIISRGIRAADMSARRLFHRRQAQVAHELNF